MNSLVSIYDILVPLPVYEVAREPAAGCCCDDLEDRQATAHAQIKHDRM